MIRNVENLMRHTSLLRPPVDPMLLQLFCCERTVCALRCLGSRHGAFSGMAGNAVDHAVVGDWRLPDDEFLEVRLSVS